MNAVLRRVSRLIPCPVAAWATGQPCTTIRPISNKRRQPSAERYDVPGRPCFDGAPERTLIERRGLRAVNNVSGNHT